MKTVTIENLLNWAFCQELCKVGPDGGGPGVMRAGWQAMSEMAALGTLIDATPNRFGVIPDLSDDRFPHADALAVGHAVKGLADRGGFEIGAGWNPFSDWPDERGLVAAEVARVLGSRAAGAARDGKQVVNLVITCAVLQRGPDWRAAPPREAMVCHNGKPAWFVERRFKDRLGASYVTETDGFDRRKQRPVVNAYRKWRLSSPLTGAILSRLDWQIWQSALETLADTLPAQLTAHRLADFRPVRSPWALPANSLQAIEKARF